MKIQLNKWIFIMFMITLYSYSQNVTIDYSTQSNANCVFVNPTYVSGITHLATIGQPKISNGILKLDYDANNGTPKGTEYQILYNFKAGYSYQIVINASTTSVSLPTGLKLTFGNNGSSPFCNGMGLITGNGNPFGNFPNQQINSGNLFLDFTFSANALPAAESSLRIATYTNFVSSPSNQTVQIKNVKIIETPPPPSFTLSPTILSLACGDTSPRTFTVTPANIPSGATVTYQWSYPGWNFVSSTSNSLTLQPTSGTILPSNVSVIPSINGVPKPSMSCIISQEIFNPSTSEIIGSENFCPGSSSSYTISNLGANTVTWSISNPAVASLSATSGGTISLTGLSNGTVTLYASITNACGQTAPKSKTFTIGLPSFPAESMTGESNPLTGENIYYSIPQAIGASSYNWYFDGGGILGTTINGWQINSGQGTTVINAKVGNPGTTVVVCKATNSCGNSIKYTYVNVRSVTSPCEGFKISIINPIKKGDNLVGRILPPIIDPCDALAKMLSQKDEKKEVALFDLFGKPVFSDFFFSDEFVFSNLNLPAGNYIINITLSNGITEKQTIIIE